MKYKLFLYDCFEKSQFEEELNQLSKQGFNALEIGWISKFGKKDTSYFYKVDILKGNKLKQTKKLMDYYDRYSYSYCGKRGRLIFFKGDSKRNFKEREKEYTEYLKNQLFYNSCLFFLTGLISVLYFSFLLKKELSHVITNGQIVLFLIPVIILISSMLFVFSKIMHALQFKANQKLQKSILNPIAVLLLIFSLCLIPFGCILDSISRGKQEVKDVLTLKDFDKESYGKTMSFAHSFIVDTKTFVDENEQGDVLYETVYDISNDTDQYYESFVQSHVTEDKIEMKDGYLYTSEVKNDSLVLKIDHKIIDITASFDLEPYYQKIVLYYKGE